MTPLTSLQAHSCSCWGVKITSLCKLAFAALVFTTLDPRHFRGTYKHFHVVSKPELRSWHIHVHRQKLFGLAFFPWFKKKCYESTLLSAGLCIPPLQFFLRKWEEAYEREHVAVCRYSPTQKKMEQIKGLWEHLAIGLCNLLPIFFFVFYAVRIIPKVGD